MSDLELLADTMQEWSSTSGDHHMLAAAAIRRLIKLQAAQAQAGDEVTVKGFANGGSCAVVQGIAVYGLDVGDKLYTRPQPAVQPAVQQAIRAMEWMLCDYEHLNTMGQPLSANWPQRVQAVKDAVAKLQAAQAKAGDGEAPVGYYSPSQSREELAFSFTYDGDDFVPLYTHPQPAVNQQLLEAIKIAIECLGLHGDGFVDLGAMTVLQDFVAAIKAAQEGK
jgi:hypothetical protein